MELLYPYESNLLYPYESNLLYPYESNQLLKLAIQLHSELGYGFKKKIYQDAFEVLLKENEIPYIREAHITLQYHGVSLNHDFFYDFLCYNKIGIEIKALSEVMGECEAQIINYLHVSNHKLGLLLNFGEESLWYRWYPNTKHYRATANID